ncbi:MAG: hypothetical protein K6D94_09555, partial [Clostridiales bacterium]|nr:hypothetical protein [Clostridiales bacterium]
MKSLMKNLSNQTLYELNVEMLPLCDSPDNAARVLAEKLACGASTLPKNDFIGFQIGCGKGEDPRLLLAFSSSSGFISRHDFSKLFTKPLSMSDRKDVPPMATADGFTAEGRRICALTYEPKKGKLTADLHDVLNGRGFAEKLAGIGASVRFALGSAGGEILISLPGELPGSLRNDIILLVEGMDAEEVTGSGTEDRRCLLPAGMAASLMKSMLGGFFSLAWNDVGSERDSDTDSETDSDLDAVSGWGSPLSRIRSLSDVRRKRHEQLFGS